MSIGISFTILGKGYEFYTGTSTGKFTFKIASITVLGFGAEVAIRI